MVGSAYRRGKHAESTTIRESTSKPKQKLTMEINNVFDTGSPALADYLRDNPVGKKIQAGGGQVWTIIKVNKDENIPPNPTTSKASTKVNLVLA
jgi:hypothetical protein